MKLTDDENRRLVSQIHDERVVEYEEDMGFPYLYEIEDRRCRPSKVVAQTTTWEAKQAALRLLFGTSLVLPAGVDTITHYRETP